MSTQVEEILANFVTDGFAVHSATTATNFLLDAEVVAVNVESVPGYRQDELNRVLLHWRVSLQLRTRKERSLLLDTFKEISGANTKHQVQTCEQEFLVVNEVTVGVILALIVSKDMHLFCYNSNGSGCRTWVQMFLKMMQEAGFLPDGSLLQFNAFVDKFKRESPEYWIPEETGAIVGNTWS